jgi:membrane protease YdiL (CAAX protease family)
VFRSQLPELPAGFAFPPIWQGSLLLLGAAVREEILFRLFALNLCTWIGMRLFRKKQPTPQIIWAANVLTAFAFAVLHLVPASRVLELNPTAMTLVLLLATVAGTAFGYIYWRYDLVMAVFSHAIGGLVIYLGVRGTLAFNE